MSKSTKVTTLKILNKENRSMSKESREKAYRKVLEKVQTEGYQNLTEDEINVLKYHDIDDGHMVNTDDYNDIQTKDIKERKDKGENLTDDEKAVLVGKKQDDRNKEVDVILHGVNDVWSKHYDYKEDGVEFDVSAHMPNIKENGRILSLLNQYLLGTSMMTSNYWYQVYHGLALLRVCGETVPDELKDDEHIYIVSANWLKNIDEDFSQWMSRFRR